MAHRKTVSRSSSLRGAPVLKPVAWAVLTALAMPAFNPAVAGPRVTGVWPSARAASARVAFIPPTRPGDQTIPVPVSALKDANGQLVNIAEKGSTTGQVTVTGQGTANEQTRLDLNQTTLSAIVRFNSFDLGSKATVDVRMISNDARALYTIGNSTAPSQIYGTLNTYYLDAQGQRHTGGELYLINGNGILFGQGARVNVGGLFASTLGLNSSNDFMQSGLNGSIGSANASFSGGDTYAPEKYVRVMEDAHITTASGGRVFLMAGYVENAGKIETPSGQTVLAAGNNVYLNQPSVGASPLYMSEANVNVPALKGLLVEVDGQVERAVNSGTINTPTGNTTIVGWAVEQRGRISATTSVTQNGSVYLLARSGVVTASDTGTLTKRATQGGSLILGEGSEITITPDQALNANGKAPAVSTVTPFNASVVELSGKTIDMEAKAKIVAPHANINARASSAPIYTVGDLVESGQAVVDPEARLTLGAKAVIDASGTTDAQVSVDRYFVKTELLGYQDLKDAPLQKDGPIYRQELTVDVRGTSPILGDLQSYRDGLTRTANELMSAGGKVALSSTGSVLTDATSRVDVSGGQVKVLAAAVQPSVLVAANGQRHTLNDAPADVQYVGIEGHEAAQSTRFGDILAPAADAVSHVEAGYTEGRAAGKLSVVAPLSVLDGQVKGSTVVGERQRAGTDALAAVGRLMIGTSTNRKAGDTLATAPIKFASSTFNSAVLQDFTITASVPGSRQDATQGRIASNTLNASGFGDISIASDGQLVQEAGAHLLLPKLGAVTLNAAGAGGITLGADITATGGSITARAAEVQSRASGTLTVKSGVKLDVAGDLVNQRLDGVGAGSAVAGGSISLKSDHGLVVEANTAMDVSGGLTVTTAGAFKGTSAGGITLEGLNAPSVAATDQVRIGATMSGYSMTQGGSLRIKAGDVTIADGAGLKAGATPAGLDIGSDFFTKGGFQSYDIDGVNSLTIKADTLIQPRVDNWLVRATARHAATGTRVADVMKVATLQDGLRKPVNLSLSSSGVNNSGQGRLAMEIGARIQADVASKVTLSAGRNLSLDGSVTAKGGQIMVKLQSDQLRGAITDDNDLLYLGRHAVLDVSGTTVLDPRQPVLRLGDVLDGGTITVGAFNTQAQSEAAVVIDKGAQLLADGATGVVDVARPLGTFGSAYTRQLLASDGGNINIVTGGGGGVLAGKLSAKAGGADALGGTLNVSSRTPGASTSAAARASTVRTLVLQDALVTDTILSKGTTTVSTQAIREGGFADAYLTSLDQIETKGDVTLDMARYLRLDAPVLKVSPGSKANLKAGSALQMGSSLLASGLPAGLLTSSGGTGQLNLQGRFVELFGQQALQGVGQFKANSDTELRLRGILTDDKKLTGGLDTQADVNWHAQQVVPTTATQYTLNAAGHAVVIDGGDASAETPLSGGSALTINARTIDQNGVLRAPFGSIALNATERITLGDGSLTSVSGDGMQVPYGETTGNGTQWLYNGQAVAAPPEKSITLNAAGQTVSVHASANVNLDGGGELVAWEFVPGPGGSKDNFLGAPKGAFAVVPTVTQYAPSDQAILAGGGLSLDPGSANALSLGSQITLGAHGQIPAGTYAILSARYALLPGAYLVTPVAAGSKSVALGYQQSLHGGAEVVGGLLGTSGVKTPATAQASQFVVMTSELARRYSEIKTTTADQFFTGQAKAAGTTVPRLAGDAGRLSILADHLLLNGQTSFKHAVDKRGGQLDIASNHINLGDAGRAASADALNLSYDQLNQTGADSIMLGGVRQGINANGQVDAQVSAGTVTVYQSLKDGRSQTLETGDLILAATDTVELKDGVQIKARPLNDASPTLAFQGDGALLRISGDEAASTVRTGASGVKGDLLLGQKLVLSGGTIDAEATHATQIVSTVDAGSTLTAKRITLAANGIAVGGGSASSGTGAPALVLSDKLRAQLAKASDLTLRSFGSVDLYNNAQLGQANSKSLTLDTAEIRVMPGATSSTLTAGEVRLSNTSQGSAVTPTAGQAALNIVATGQGGGSGHVTLGEGLVTASGVKTTSIDAAGSVVFQGQGGLQTPGDLNLAAQSVTAKQGAQSTLSATGGLSIASTQQTGTKAQAGVGAAVSMQAGTRIEQGGTVVLPSGVLKLNADQSIHFSGQSRTDLAGISKQIDGVAIDSMGGALTVVSQKADIRLDQGGVLNVSAGSGKGMAGSLSFSAANGAVQLDGQLLATSASGQTGGQLSIDSRQAVDLKALADRMAQGQSATLSNFSKSIKVRNRSGDQSLAQGTTLTAQEIQLSSDGGKLTIQGALDVSGDTGGTITLAAGQDLEVATGASLRAKATGAGQAGGQVALSSADGVIKMTGGSVDVGGAGSGGTLSLRAQQTDQGVAVEGPVKTTVVGAGRIVVEGVKRYEADWVDDGLVSAIASDAEGFMAGQQVAAKLSSSQPGLASLVQVKAGAEVFSQGDMTVDSANLVGGTPVNLTLRAGGDLNVTGNVSTGFSAAGVAQQGASGDLRLVGGADLNAANVMSTKGGDAGDVSIGNSGGTSVAVRTTTGNIDIAAARDVKLINPQAVVYTTGHHVQAADAPGYSVPAGTLAGANASNIVVKGAPGLAFLTNGGSVSVRAGRDVAALPDPFGAAPQLVTDWWWRWKNSAKDNQPSWWSRYDKFQQGFATFGGGNVAVQAGRDAWNVNASALASGYLGTDGKKHSFGGGHVAVTAARDVIGGVVAASKALAVTAGRNIAASSSDNDLAWTAPVPARLQLVYGNGISTVMARNQLDLGRATPVGLLDPVSESKAAAARPSYSFYLYESMPDAGLSVASIAGDLSYESALPSVYNDSRQRVGDVQAGISVVPTDSGFMAAQGSVSLGDLWQMSGEKSNLTILARDKVSVNVIHQFGVDGGHHPDVASDSTAASTFYPVWVDPVLGGDRTPVRIIAEQGDVQYAFDLELTKGLRMIAGRDIEALNAASIELTHQSNSESSLLRAGRDIRFSQASIVGGLLLDGPGQLLVTAGRHIDLYTSNGIKASGNLSNSALPKGSADVSVMAGVSLAQGDITQASAAYFQLLGGLGGDAYLGMMYDQIVAQSGQTGARPFASLTLAERMNATRTMVGEVDYQAAVVRFIHQRYDAKLSTETALARFNTLSPAVQSTLLGNLLTPLWVSTVPSQDRLNRALSLAGQLGNPHNQALIDFVNQRDTKGQVTDIRTALQKFDLLTADQQAIFLGKVLVNTVKQSIDQAANLAADERDAAQAVAYNAIDTVFPSASTDVTHINMGASQIQTQQGSAIHVLNPKGSINVGQLTAEVAGSKTASDLGIITAGGGDVGVIVRDDVIVNTSRIFTLVEGDEVLWSSVGSVDAGRGAKTATAAIVPVYYLDAQSKLQIDVTSAVAGSGILATGDAFIAAPRGDINAGDAGIKAKKISVGGGKLVNTDAIVAVQVTGAPPAPAVNLAVTAPVPQNTAAGLKDAQQDEDGPKKKRKRNILLDFLGFGDI
ncbi:MAG: filamentous hemagglutinin N-terminal domain-containing protein [Rubrivivax sp.]|nr:MAG: filamentous hemagglutinin N-terminal domain-containing protein [Rubrivivax sp.]